MKEEIGKIFVYFPNGYLLSKKYVDDYAQCDVKGSSTKKIMTIYFNWFHEKNSTTSIVLSLKKMEVYFVFFPPYFLRDKTIDVVEFFT